MSRYENEIAQLTGWFKNRLEPFDAFQMTEENYQTGIDVLPENLKALTSEAFDHWLKHRDYELSYSQMCQAFFQAAHAAGKITLIPRHPVFRLNTKVFIREVTIRGTKETVANVPATITYVHGDAHTVTGDVAIGNDPAHRWGVTVQTNDLEKELALR